MANTWIEPPPPQKGKGCFAKGCIILLVFAFLLAIACGVGLYWGFRHHSAVMHGVYWATKAHVVADSPKEVPVYEAPQAEIQVVKERWVNFKDTIQQQGSAEIELTANDLNSLIQSNRRLRGNVFVSIEGDRIHVQTSVPLQEYARQKGYYLNADIFIEYPGAHSLDDPPLKGIVINGRALPSDVLTWQYNSQPLRNYLRQFQLNNSLGSVEIRDGKIILRSRTE